MMKQYVVSKGATDSVESKLVGEQIPATNIENATKTAIKKGYIPVDSSREEKRRNNPYPTFNSPDGSRYMVMEIYLHECDVEVRLPPTSWELIGAAIGDAIGYAEHTQEVEDKLIEIAKIIEKKIKQVKKTPRKPQQHLDYSDPTKFPEGVQEVLRESGLI